MFNTKVFSKNMLLSFKRQLEAKLRGESFDERDFFVRKCTAGFFRYVSTYIVGSEEVHYDDCHILEADSAYSTKDEAMFAFELIEEYFPDRQSEFEMVYVRKAYVEALAWVNQELKPLEALDD